eukprot:tig00021127_g18727.t1
MLPRLLRPSARASGPTTSLARSFSRGNAPDLPLWMLGMQRRSGSESAFGEREGGAAGGSETRKASATGRDKIPFDGTIIREDIDPLGERRRALEPDMVDEEGHVPPLTDPEELRQAPKSPIGQAAMRENMPFGTDQRVTPPTRRGG